MRRLYLDNASESWPKAPGLGECMAEAAATVPGCGNAVFGGRENAAVCRELLARLLETRNGECIALTVNATQALNMALLGFPWKEGDVVLTTVAEHSSVLRPLYELKRRGTIAGFIAMPVREDGSVSELELERKLDELHPRAFVFTHANPVTGTLNDAWTMAEICRGHGVKTILDASLTAGLFPLRPMLWDIDILAASGHKYLLGPTGTGFLYVGAGVELAPTITGSTSSHNDRWTMPDEMPWRLEAGSKNDIGLAGLAYSLEWLNEHPADVKLIEENTLLLEHGLKKAGASPICVEGKRMPLTAFTSALEPAHIREILRDSYDVYCSAGLHHAPLLLPSLGLDERGCVRVSLSRFNTRDEIYEFTSMMREILSE